MRRNNINNFWEKVEKTNSCWLWREATSLDGYGLFYINGTTEKAHRWIFFYLHPNADKTLFVCHRCDVRNCVNPDHLWLGTNLDNTRDSIAKGRNVGASQPGELHGQAKLTDKQARYIKFGNFKKGTMAALARSFGVKPSVICHIRKGQAWKYLTTDPSITIGIVSD